MNRDLGNHVPHVLISNARLLGTREIAMLRNFGEGLAISMVAEVCELRVEMYLRRTDSGGPVPNSDNRR